MIGRTYVPILHLRTLMLACLAIALTVACGGKPSGGQNNNNSTYCEDESDCPAGWVCESNICVAGGDAGVEPDAEVTEPDIAVDPLTVDFGSALLGVAVEESVTIRNVGTGDLTILSITLEDDGNAGEFTAQPTGTINQIIEPGGEMTVDVELTNLDQFANTGRLLIVSDDSDEALVQVALISELKGNGDLEACVMHSESFTTDCGTAPERIDYGTLDYGDLAVQDVALTNQGDGNNPLVLTDIYVTNGTGHGDLFSLQFFEVVQDATGLTYVELTDFPTQSYLLGVDDGVGDPEVFIVRATFEALVDGQSVPPEDLTIETNDPLDPIYEIPFAGNVLCPPDTYNYDGQPGCEYACSITNGGVEECDGLDNNCDGNIDESVTPGLCLICDANGAPVLSDDDLNCGNIDCSQWFAHSGNTGPMDTDYCSGHEPLTTDRCEGDADCKDANSDDCVGQPALATPAVSCGTCQYVDGCMGTTPGSCANYAPGTPTTLCVGCDGAGGEAPVGDDVNCGAIDCASWYAKLGTTGPTDTDSCHGHQALDWNRCEGAGDCKDANSADCLDATPLATAQVSCGTCQRVIGCVGNMPGSCENYLPGTPTNLCGECDGAGGERGAPDDASCGTINCAGWYTKTGTTGETETENCFAHTDIAGGAQGLRCEGLGDCKDPNSDDCNAQPLLTSAAVTCGTCQFMQGCAGTTAGSCANYSEHTRTALCTECDGNGGLQASTDDITCGTIDCSGWYEKDGSASATGTESCFGLQNLITDRCEGQNDCKDPNSDDCVGQTRLGTAAIQCGTCQYMQGCAGTTPGTCANYGPGEDTGLCRECNGSGAERMPADDTGCGTIACGGWYAISGGASPTGTEECFARQDITANRCSAVGDCKDPNSTDCSTQPPVGTAQASCGTCKYMTGCVGTTAGTCTNYTATTDTGTCRECDGNGAERMPGDDTVCGSIDCASWYQQQGTQGATTTQTCHGSASITGDRCKTLGNCKVANTADCTGQGPLGTPQITCGTCKYLSGCSANTPGSCTNYSATTDTGTCRECDGAGAERMPGDDTVCGSIDCSAWYLATGTEGPTTTQECFGRQSITSARCKTLGNCKADNSADCSSQSALSSAQATCGVCQRMTGCTGTTGGSCINYGGGTDTGTCRECDGSGGERMPTDDGVCGSIDCSAWYQAQGTQGPTATQTCHGSVNITGARCKTLGNCKDPNSTDCTGQGPLASATVTCGTCKYLSGCAGAAPGTCTNYPATEDTGTCRECDGNGAERMPGDDTACGAIDCGGWYAKQGTQGPTTVEECFGHQDLTGSRCASLGTCKAPNSTECAGQPREATPQVTCGVCKRMSNCTGALAGTCINYGDGTDTGLCRECDGGGDERMPSDDSGCSTVNCAGYYQIVGTAGHLTEERCYATASPTSNRCATLGNCKDSNTSAACNGLAPTGAALVTCGICKEMSGCSGTTTGTCSPSAEDLDTGTCRECNGSGGERMPSDDNDCSSVNCLGYYQIQGTRGPTTTETCHATAAPTDNRCATLGNCKDSNTPAACSGQSATGGALVTCSICKEMGGCSGTTAGSCVPSAEFADTGECRECDGSGSERMPADDSACSGVNCAGYYQIVGTAGHLTEERCYATASPTTNRCATLGNCKTSNSAAACGGLGTAGGALVTCGICQVMSGCSGTSTGSCAPSSPGLDTGECRECDGAGGQRMPADDSACSGVNCLGYYQIVGVKGSTTTEWCYATAAPTTNRCDTLGSCKTSNSAAACSGLGTTGSALATCGTCKEMSGCSGTTAGSCVNSTNGTPTSGTCGVGACQVAKTCLNGAETCTPGPQTGGDTDCDNIDDNCNGQTDENYAPYTCGVGACVTSSICSAGGNESCNAPSSMGDDVPDSSFEDTNCDGYDGDLSNAILVANGGANTSTCGISTGGSNPVPSTTPCATISYGVSRAVSTGREHVYIQAGTYSGVVTLQSGISLYGGYDSNWERDLRTQPGHTVTINGGYDSGTGQYMTIKAISLTGTSVIADLYINGPNASGTVSSRGRSSYTVYARSTADLQITRVTIDAGNGANGITGSVGSNFWNQSRPPTAGNGGNAREYTTNCNTSRQPGGSAGSNSSCSSNSYGGTGGQGGQMDTSCGWTGFCSNCAATAGLAGASGAQYATYSVGYRGSGSGTCTPSGGYDGNTGRVSNGSGGTGAGSYGQISNYFWYGKNGYTGSLGVNGGGGGGGGGSGGCDTGTDEYGAGGGGGGAGGCRAPTAGGYGYGAGGSFGVFGYSATITVTNSTIIRGTGGVGGTGGEGRSGQPGGYGGNGGNGDGDAGPGGDGGDGGRGGHSGGGGGGAGGHSYGIYSYNSTVSQSGNAFSSGAQGAGGSGGWSPGYDGNQGNTGSLGNVGTCSSTSGC